VTDRAAEFARRGWQVPAFEVDVLRPKRTRHVIMIPVINEGDRIQRQLRDMAALGLPEQADIVVVDGGSTDGSLSEAFLRCVDVRALITKRGSGRLSAQLRCGYAWALLEGYDGIVTIDGNGKDGVAAVPAFLRALDEGYGYVQASRFLRGGHRENTPLSRLIAIRLIHAPMLSLAARHWFTDTTQGFRAYSADYLLDPRVAPFRDVFANYELLAYLTVRASQLGYRVRELPTARVYPKGEATPTKISGLKGLADLLMVVFNTVAGRYAPRGR
jgi:glycosyltransferase involved in cell wall biosynthesis